MKFQIRRTSLWRDKQPCPEANSEQAVYLDYRTVASIEEARKKEWFESWWKMGINHRVDPIKNMIVADRKELDNIWTIEVNSLEDLLRLYNEYGTFIIKEGDYKDVPLKIEIYDDYRESQVLRKVSEQEAQEPKHFIVEGIYSRVKDGTRIAVQVTYPEGLDLVDVWPAINNALEQNHWMRVD